ncbi:hypothetical protein J7I84_07130 [Arthrobacter sp. ISL-85]|uniref:DUF6527 family protein n=1 Tax=Arthrobacter sp. ISL-85 TaxID=2819115 RepID=UPI001BEC5773|nr:DUF6527 family protein [Arthrobacter sp. ISL-85]MBT2566273.1 hypothetical protein [Arthrobacter sp. ISL-85]
MTGAHYYSASFVDSFPRHLESGVLYISTKYSTASHSCACGCGNEVVTKLSAAKWRIVYDGQISLKPSVGAVALPCNSHYYITRGEVEWHRKLTRKETVLAREADRRSMEEHRGTPRPVWITRVWRKLFR